MTNSESNNGNPASRDASAGLRLELTLDLTSFQVSIGGEAMPLSLAQMICDEALRLLAEQRKMAAAQQLGKAITDAARTQEILDHVGRGSAR